MLREGKLGVSQKQFFEQQTWTEEQRLTSALIYIISMATIVTFFKILHYLSCYTFGTHQSDAYIIVSREIARIALVINASVNVFITFWSCKRVREELRKDIYRIKKVNPMPNNKEVNLT